MYLKARKNEKQEKLRLAVNKAQHDTALNEGIKLKVSGFRVLCLVPVKACQLTWLFDHGPCFRA